MDEKQARKLIDKSHKRLSEAIAILSDGGIEGKSPIILDINAAISKLMVERKLYDGRRQRKKLWHRHKKTGYLWNGIGRPPDWLYTSKREDIEIKDPDEAGIRY